jgi:hypothetical protein
MYFVKIIIVGCDTRGTVTMGGKSESQASVGEKGNSSRKRVQFFLADFGEKEERWVLGKEHQPCYPLKRPCWVGFYA